MSRSFLVQFGSVRSALLVAAVVAFHGTIAFSSAQNDEEPPYLAPAPEVALASDRYRATDAERAEIAALIEQLIEIDKPDYGMAPWMSGAQFAPVAASRSFETGIIMVDHGLETASTVRRLVVLGPKAIPALLAALDDSTPSKLVVEHSGGFGGMWHGREVPINPANTRELAAQAEHPDVLQSVPAGFGEMEDLHKHVVTRGDICFVVLGQIVNRSYQSVRYQPTACRVINSPSHDPAIANALRAIWKDDDPAAAIFQSLMMDFRTRGKSADYQIGAVMRLLYYFPEESRDLIVKRLDDFDVMKARANEGDWSDWQRKMLHNGGARVDEFITAVAFHDHPDITDALIRVAQRTDDVYVLAACVTEHTAERNPDVLLARMAELLNIAPPPEQGPFGGEYHTLMAAANFFSAQARPLFDTYVKHGTLECRRAVIHALAKPLQPVPWAVEFLQPFLDDRTDTGWQYGPEYDRKPIRVCDEAAQVLSTHVPEATFKYEGETANLDAQIVNIKRRIAGEPVPDEVTVAGPQFDFASLPVAKPVASLDLDQRIGGIYEFSDRNTIYCGVGYRANCWAYDTMAIDLATGAVIDRVKVDEWNGGVSLLRPRVADQAYCYHADGLVIVRDLRTGAERARIQTPFHDAPGFDDPLQIRNLNDVALSGDGEWIIALTPDGALHAINTSTGGHEIVWQRESEVAFGHLHGSIVPLQGTNRFIIELFGEDDVLRVWDQDKRTISELTRVPTGGWRSGWGRYACNHLNAIFTLWDLEDKRPVELPIPDGVAIADITCDSTRRLWILSVSDKSIYVFQLPECVPIAKLEAPLSEGRVTLTMSDDDRWLFWQTDLTNRDPATGETSNERAFVAVFDLEQIRMK